MPNRDFNPQQNDGLTVMSNSSSLSLTASTRHSAVPVAWVERLHARFLAIWPSASIPQAGTKSWDMFCAEWAEGLAGFSPTAIREAIAECRDTLEFPPSIAKFRAVCREHERRLMLEARQHDEMTEAREPWHERKQRAQGHLRSLLAIVRENPVVQVADDSGASGD